MRDHAEELGVGETMTCKLMYSSNEIHTVTEKNAPWKKYLLSNIGKHVAIARNEYIK